MLEGREFFVLTDQKPLCQALGNLSAPCSARLQLHLAYISVFTHDIRHIPSEENVAAAALSHYPQLSCLATSALPPFLDTKMLSAAQVACSATVALTADRRFHVVRRLLADGHVLLRSTSTGVDRPLLLPEFRSPAFHSLHALSHPGICGSSPLLT